MIEIERFLIPQSNSGHDAYHRVNVQSDAVVTSCRTKVGTRECWELNLQTTVGDPVHGFAKEGSMIPWIFHVTCPALGLPLTSVVPCASNSRTVRNLHIMQF